MVFLGSFIVSDIRRDEDFSDCKSKVHPKHSGLSAPFPAEKRHRERNVSCPKTQYKDRKFDLKAINAGTFQRL